MMMMCITSFKKLWILQNKLHYFPITIAFYLIPRSKHICDTTIFLIRYRNIAIHFLDMECLYVSGFLELLVWFLESYSCYHICQDKRKVKNYIRIIYQ